jgi:hypothetical protein
MLARFARRLRTLTPDQKWIIQLTVSTLVQLFLHFLR